MAAKVIFAKAVELVLLAMLEAVEEAVAKGELSGDPSIRFGIGRTPAYHDVGIAVVARELQKVAEARAWSVSRCNVDRVVAFADVEGGTVHIDRLDGQRNKDVRVGVAIPVSIGGKVIRIEKIANLEVLRHRLTVVAGDSGSKVLRRLDASGSCFNRQTWDRDGSARPAWIGVEHVIMDHEVLRGIG